jgi:TRAP-type transport system small permease protein
MRGAAYGSRGLAIAGLALLLLYAFGTLLDGLSRTFLNLPIDFVGDVAPPAIAVALSCCFPYAFIVRANIVITLIDRWTPKGAGVWLGIFSWLVTLVILCCFSFQFVNHARELLDAGETTALFEVPVAPFWFIVAANLSFTSLIHACTLPDWVSSRVAEAGKH